MEKFLHLTIYVLCILEVGFAQSFAPNIWTVDSEPTKNMNVPGMTFFHASSGDSPPSTQGTGSTSLATDFASFRPETQQTQPGMVENLERNPQNQRAQQQSRGISTSGQFSQQSMNVPDNIRDNSAQSSTFLVGDAIQNPSASRDGSTNFFNGISDEAGSMSEFTSNFGEPVTSGNEDNTWPYMITDTGNQNEPGVDLNTLGLQSNTFMDSNSNNPFASGIAANADGQGIRLRSGRNNNEDRGNSDIRGLDDSQSFNTFPVETNSRNAGAINGGAPPLLDTNSIGDDTGMGMRKPSMSISGEFKDLSTKPMFRVKSKFVDKSDNRTPGLKTQSSFVDMSKRVEVMPTTNTLSTVTNRREPALVGQTTKFENTVSIDARRVSQDTGDTINFSDLASNTPKNVGQYTTTVNPVAITQTPATTPFVPTAARPIDPRPTFTAPKSTDLQIESLYPEAPFPIDKGDSVKTNIQFGNAGNGVGIDSQRDTGRMRPGVNTNNGRNMNNVNIMNNADNINDMNTANDWINVNNVNNNMNNNVNNENGLNNANTAINGNSVGTNNAGNMNNVNMNNLENWEDTKNGMNTNSAFDNGRRNSIGRPDGSSRGTDRSVTGVSNANQANSDMFRPNQIPNHQDQNSNVHVPFVSSQQAGSSTSGNGQFRTDPNVQLINPNGVNGVPDRSDNVPRNQRVTTDISGRQMVNNGISRNNANINNINTGDFQNNFAVQNSQSNNANIQNNLNGGFQGQNTVNNQKGFNNANGNNFGNSLQNGGPNNFINSNANNPKSQNSGFQQQNINSGQLSNQGQTINQEQNFNSGSNVNQQNSGRINNNFDIMNGNNIQNSNMATVSGNQGNNRAADMLVISSNNPQQQNNGPMQGTGQGIGNNRNPRPFITNPPSSNVNQQATVNNQGSTSTSLNTNGMGTNMGSNNQNRFGNNGQVANGINAGSFGNIAPANNGNQPPNFPGQPGRSNFNTNVQNNQASFDNTHSQLQGNPSISGNSLSRDENVNLGRASGTMAGGINANANTITGSTNAILPNNSPTSGATRGSTGNGISSQDDAFQNRFSSGNVNNPNLRNGFNGMAQRNFGTPIPSQVINNNVNRNNMVPGNQNTFPSNGQQQSSNVISQGGINGFPQSSNQMNQGQFGLNNNINNRQNNPLVGNSVPNNNNNVPNTNNFRNPQMGMQQPQNNRGGPQGFVNSQNGQIMSQGLSNNQNDFGTQQRMLNRPNGFGVPQGSLSNQNGFGLPQGVLNNPNGQRNNLNNNFQVPQNLRDFADFPQGNTNSFVNGNFPNNPNNFQNPSFGTDMNPLASQQALFAQARARGFSGSPQQFLQQQAMFSQNGPAFLPFG